MAGAGTVAEGLFSAQSSGAAWNESMKIVMTTAVIDLEILINQKIPPPSNCKDLNEDFSKKRLLKSLKKPKVRADQGIVSFLRVER